MRFYGTTEHSLWIWLDSKRLRLTIAKQRTHVPPDVTIHSAEIMIRALRLFFATFHAQIYILCLFRKHSLYEKFANYALISKLILKKLIQK